MIEIKWYRYHETTGHLTGSKWTKNKHRTDHIHRIHFTICVFRFVSAWQICIARRRIDLNDLKTKCRELLKLIGFVLLIFCLFRFLNCVAELNWPNRLSQPPANNGNQRLAEHPTLVHKSVNQVTLNNIYCSQARQDIGFDRESAANLQQVRHFIVSSVRVVSFLKCCILCKTWKKRNLSIPQFACEQTRAERRTAKNRGRAPERIDQRIQIWASITHPDEWMNHTAWVNVANISRKKRF